MHLPDHPLPLLGWQQGILQLAANNLDLKVSHGIPRREEPPRDAKYGPAVVLKSGVQKALWGLLRELVVIQYKNENQSQKL